MASRERAIVNNLNERARFYGMSDELSLEDVRACLSFYSHTCLNCGTKPATSVDHVKPLALGGENKLENLQLLCVKCNKSKGDSEKDFRNGRICVRANTPKTRKPNKTSWKPGVSGNPNGRPSAGMSWQELIVKEGEKYSEALGMTRKEWLVMRAYDLAGDGNAAILREIWQRSEPQDTNINLNVSDVSSASDAELERIALAGGTGVVVPSPREAITH